MSRNLSWADVLDKDLAYVVVTKENRLQVIVKPTKSQLRLRGKRGWSLVAVHDAEEGSNGQVALPASLEEAVHKAISQIFGGSKPKKEKTVDRKKKGRS